MCTFFNTVIMITSQKFLHLLNMRVFSSQVTTYTIRTCDNPGVTFCCFSLQPCKVSGETVNTPIHSYNVRFKVVIGIVMPNELGPLLTYCRLRSLFLLRIEIPAGSSSCKRSYTCPEAQQNLRWCMSDAFTSCIHGAYQSFPILLTQKVPHQRKNYFYVKGV